MLKQTKSNIRPFKSQQTTTHQKIYDENENKSVVEDLFSNLGLDINSWDADGKANLHHYAQKNELYFAAMLLMKGADVNIKTKGYFPVQTPLYISTMRGHKDFVKLLVNRKANINEQDDNEHKTALHLCAEGGHEQIADILLAAGADVNLADMKGETALHLAARLGNKKILEKLLESGAKINSASESGKTALHYSTEYGKDDIVKLLLEAGASADIRDKVGQTALMTAASSGCTEIALTLVKYTDCLDAVDEYNNTALHYSSQNGLTEVVKVLLEAGANVDMRGQLGRTPLWCSVRNKKIDVMKELIQHGANLDIEDDSGQTALDMAKMYSDVEAVAVLRQHGAKSSKENKMKMEVVLDSSKSEMEFEKVIAGTSFASGNTTPSTYTAPSMETTPTASITDPDASDDTTPSTYTAPSIDTEASASSTTTEASDETTPNSHTAPSIDKILTVCTTTIPVDNVATTTNPDITILATRTTTTGTSTNTAKQFEKFTKSTGENESYQNHNLSQTKQQMINGNNQTLLDNRMKILDQSDTYHDHSAGLDLEKAHKQDTMDIQETTGVLGATKNKEKRNKHYPKQNTMDKTPIDWGTTTPCVNVDVSPSTEDTTTAPTGSITAIVVTTPIMDTASATNVTSTVCNTTADASDDTSTSTDTIPASFTTPTAYTTATPATSTNSTTQMTSSTTTSTNAIKTTQLKHPPKSTHNMYKSHQKYNITHPSLETLVENGQTCLGKNMEALDDSDSGQNFLAQLGRTNDKKDMMVKQEKTRLGSIVKNKTFIRNNDKRKKIFDKLVRHNSSDHIENPTKSMKNSSSVRKPKKGESNLLRSGSADSLESSTKYFRKRIRTSIDDMKHQSYMSANGYRKRCFWKYKPYHRKRMKNTNLKSTGLDLNHSTKPNTLEWSDMGYHNETKRKTQMLRENEVSLPVKTVLNTVQWALSTKMTRNCGNTVNTIVNVNLNYTANIIRDCNEVNIENVKYLTIDGKFGGQDG